MKITEIKKLIEKRKQECRIAWIEVRKTELLLNEYDKKIRRKK